MRGDGYFSTTEVSETEGEDDDDEDDEEVDDDEDDEDDDDDDTDILNQNDNNDHRNSGSLYYSLLNLFSYILIFKSKIGKHDELQC